MAGEFDFRPQHRLQGTQQYTDVFKQRRALRGTLFDLHFRPNQGNGARLGLVVPKRNARLSVTRNYCKRVAREIFRVRRAGLPDLDVVLRLARPTGPVQEKTLGPRLREDIETLLNRLPR